MSSSPLGTRTLKLSIDGNDHTADVTHVSLESAAADSDITTFADAASGGARQYSLKFTATQDPLDPDSIWSKVWTAVGTDVPAVVLPYGGTAPTETTPAIQGTLTISEPDGTLLGGDADASTTARFTMDLEWIFTEKPTLVTTSGE